MSLATKIAAGLCICPVVAAPPALLHKPTRDKIARAAGYVPKAQKPVSAPISVQPEVACAEPTPSAPLVSMGSLANPGPLALTDLPRTIPPPGGGFPTFVPPPGGGDNGNPPPPDGGGGVIPGIPEPTTWTVMVVGFGMVGAAVRRGGRTSSSPKPSSKEAAGA